MSIPNRREDVPDPSEPDGTDGSRPANRASAYDERMTGVIETATTRATTVSHRFGGVRYALTRPDEPAGGADEPDADEPGTKGTPGPDEQPDQL